MNILVVDNHTKFLQDLRSFLPGMLEVVKKEDLIPTLALENYDLLVLSGGYGVATVSHHPVEYRNEIKYITEAKIPILGICLGLEIITYALGGELIRLDNIQQGGVKINITDQTLATKLGTTTIEVYESHQWTIKALPPEMIICAHSSEGPEIIKHINKPIIGMQFHPEVTRNQKFFEWVVESFNIKK